MSDNDGFDFGDNSFGEDWDIRFSDGRPSQGWRNDPDPFKDFVPDPSDIPTSMPNCGFLSIPSSRSPSTRFDGFYEATSSHAEHNVILACHMAMVDRPKGSSIGSETGGPLGSISTLTISTRVLFPITRDQQDHEKWQFDGWQNVNKRNKVAESIEKSLATLESNGTLAASLASAKKSTHAKWVEGEPMHLRSYLATLLRHPIFASFPDTKPGPTFKHFGQGPPISCLSALGVPGEEEHALSFSVRIAKGDWGTDKWTDGDIVEADDDTSLVPLFKNPSTMLNAKGRESLEADIIQNRGTGARPSRIPQCVLGNVVLWEPNEIHP